MIRVDLTQGSEVWSQWRGGGIGGSDAAAIMGVSPYQSRQELLEHKLKNKHGFIRKTDKGKTEAMLRGTRMEPMVRQLYMDLTGNFVEVACGISQDHDWMRASFDGLSLDGLLALEIKVPNWRDHRCSLDGQVPTHYYPQVQHLLAVSQAKQLHYISFSENKQFTEAERLSPPVRVKPDLDYIADLIRAEAEFVEELKILRKSLSAG